MRRPLSIAVGIVCRLVASGPAFNHDHEPCPENSGVFVAAALAGSYAEPEGVSLAGGREVVLEERERRRRTLS